MRRGRETRNRGTRRSAWRLAAGLAIALAAGAIAPRAAADEAFWPDPGERLLQEAVATELLLDPVVEREHVEVSVEDGVVVLEGRVASLLERDRAVRIAQAVRGVRSVVDDLEVRVPALADDELRSRVVDALLRDPVTESFEIDVIAAGGTVTLAGEVDSWPERDVAGRVAAGLTGVAEVRNELRVVLDGPRSDAEIRAEVERRLRDDVHLDGELVEVAVENGHVALGGSVGSAAQRRMARLDALVPGVVDVDTSALRVLPWVDDVDLRPTKAVFRGDEEIERSIRDALIVAPRTAALGIEVDSAGGTVTLTGFVDHLAARREAVAIARDTPGVWSVRDHLHVRDPSELPDEEIQRRVQQGLRDDPRVDPDEVVATVRHGVVWLDGAVDGPHDKVRAENAAARVRGVVAVNNRILVVAATEPLIHDPFVDGDWRPDDYAWQTLPRRRVPPVSDWELARAIEEHLLWNPFVDGRGVVVTVEDGVARLRGHVDDRHERRLAAQEAREAGARSVDNDLQVLEGAADAGLE